MKTSHGGKRAGAGKPKGKRWASTIEREVAKAQYLQAVLRRLEPLAERQTEAALGQFAEIAVVEMGPSGLLLRKVTDPAEIARLVEAGKGYRILLREPDGQMSRYVTDQAIGKAEGGSVTTVTSKGGETVVTHIVQG